MSPCWKKTESKILSEKNRVPDFCDARLLLTFLNHRERPPGQAGGVSLLEKNRVQDLRCPFTKTFLNHRERAPGQEVFPCWKKTESSLYDARPLKLFQIIGRDLQARQEVSPCWKKTESKILRCPFTINFLTPEKNRVQLGPQPTSASGQSCHQTLLT